MLGQAMAGAVGDGAWGGVCHLRSCAKMAWMEGPNAETSCCFRETAKQGRRSWQGILHAWFSSKVSPGLAGLPSEARRDVSRKALGCCCAHWGAEFEGSAHLSRSPAERRWGGAAHSEVQPGQSPCSPPARLALGASRAHGGVIGVKPGWRWAASWAHGSAGLARWDAETSTDSIWVTGKSLSSSGRHFWTNRLHVVWYCVQRHLRAVLGWRRPPPWKDAAWWQNWAQSGDEVTRKLSWQLRHAAPQPNRGPWGLLSFTALLFWYVQLRVLSADPEKFCCCS